jgi:hypothetical protein
MPHDVAFDEPVVTQMHGHPVRTVEQAAQIVRSRLREQFTMRRLSTLLVLERAADGLEVAEAREAFCAWARAELPSARRAASGAH